MPSPHAITKIVLPSKRSNLLHRPRLIDFLHQNIERKLILVSASAGYGKTSLLIDFAHDTSLPVCWYSLDANDSDPRVFLEYLVAALQRQFPDFGSRTERLLSEIGAGREADVIVGSLVTEIHESIPTYFVLILDDYQLIEESDRVNRILDSFLRLLPENAHIILSGRTLPKQLTLTRLTARQEIAGLGMNELRFSSSEIRALVKQSYHVDLSEQSAAELAENSEGWITGILLTTQSMWQGLMQNLVRVPGSRGQLYTYLASEVFAQQPAELQQFLLASSILDQLGGDRCNEILGIRDAPARLLDIEQKNLFITRIDGDESWYRYHHLFQEFLETRLRESDPVRWETLHRHAAEWFGSRRAWDQAMDHYLKIGSHERVARVVEQIAKETFDAGHWTTLAKWIDALPEQIREAHPALLIRRASISREMGELDKALEFYDRALARYEELKDPEGQSKAFIGKANCLRFQGQYEQAIHYAQRALTLLGDGNQRETAQAHRTIGIAQGLRGNWKECIDELERALELYQANADPASVALTHQDLGVAQRTMGDQNAPKHFQLALDHWRLASNSSGIANTLNSIGVSHHRQGEYAKAIEILQRAQNEAHQSGQLRIEALAIASLGDVYRDQSDFARAREAYRSAYDIARQVNEGFIITYTLCALGDLVHLMGDKETADQLLSSAMEQAESHHSQYEVAIAKTALGILSYEAGNLVAAENHLNRAIELFEQGGAKRDSARAHLHLARANYTRRNYREANRQLGLAADLGEYLREDQFVVGEGQRVLPILKYAVSKKIGNGYFARALEKIQASPVVVISEEEQPESNGLKVRAYAFGSARVHVNDKPLTTTAWGSTTAKELFFLLLANPQGLRKEEILERLWSTVPAAKASSIFHSTAHRARRALGMDCITYENGVYRLDNLTLWDDVTEFKQSIDRALQTDNPESRIAAYRQALALYQGDYAEDVYNDWSTAIRSFLFSKYIGALYDLANHLDSLGRATEAIPLLKLIIEKDPLREEGYRTLMRLQAQSGDRSGAIQTFEHCQRILMRELSLAPSEQTQALYQRILTGAI